jgi:polysaccharide deacetylase family protein (PEP-CTERM system associated)
MTSFLRRPLSEAAAPDDRPQTERAPGEPRPEGVILSFDVEEHHRIEAAYGLEVPADLVEHCRRRVDVATRRLLELLARHGARATFFVVGQLARDNPSLVRAIAAAGHEVGCHGWDHTRLHRLTPSAFREDLRQSLDALREASGQPVVGYRAPTFSVTRQTAWAIDVLADAGLKYDSSIYPVRHDRYGVPGAPRSPFLARGERRSILELPLTTLKLPGCTVPMGGGGYFRLFPLWLTRWAIDQTLRDCSPRAAMLYFHPWEFDPEQHRLPLGWRGRFRTYVGVGRTYGRLTKLLQAYSFVPAEDLVRRLKVDELPTVPLAGGGC